jgi:bacterioferritin (cytochrome b1)
MAEDWSYGKLTKALGAHSITEMKHVKQVGVQHVIAIQEVNNEHDHNQRRHEALL